MLFSKMNQLFFGHVDPKKNVLRIQNIQGSGWISKCISSNKSLLIGPRLIREWQISSGQWVHTITGSDYRKLPFLSEFKLEPPRLVKSLHLRLEIHDLRTIMKVSRAIMSPIDPESSSIHWLNIRLCGYRKWNYVRENTQHVSSFPQLWHHCGRTGLSPPEKWVRMLRMCGATKAQGLSSVHHSQHSRQADTLCCMGKRSSLCSIVWTPRGSDWLGWSSERWCWSRWSRYCLTANVFLVLELVTLSLLLWKWYWRGQ